MNRKAKKLPGFHHWVDSIIKAFVLWGTVSVSYSCWMKDHKLSGSEQHKYVLFQRQKSEIGHTPLKSKCQQDWLLLESLRGECVVSLPSPASSGCLHSLAAGSSLHLHSASSDLCFQHHRVFSSDSDSPASLL